MLGRIGDGPIQSISSDVLGGGSQVTYPPARLNVKTGESLELVGAKMIFIDVVYDDNDIKMASGTIGDGSVDGEEKIIYVSMDSGCVFDLQIKLNTPDGTSGIKIARFDRSFQSLHIAYDELNGMWFLINSGATIIPPPA